MDTGGVTIESVDGRREPLVLYDWRRIQGIDTIPGKPPTRVGETEKFSVVVRTPVLGRTESGNFDPVRGRVCRP